MVRNREIDRIHLPSRRAKRTSELEQDEDLSDDTSWHSIFSPPAISKQQQKSSTDTSWYSIFSPPEDHASRRVDLPKRSRRQVYTRDMAPCRDERCAKKDFCRAPHLQAVMDRLERRRLHERQGRRRRQDSEERRRSKSKKRTKKENEEGELLEVLEALSRYDDILEHLVNKNSRLKGASKGRRVEESSNDDISCSTEQVLDELYSARMFSSGEIADKHSPTRSKKDRNSSIPSINATRPAFNSPKNLPESSNTHNPDESRRENIRYRRERLRRRQESGLNYIDGGISYRERMQIKSEPGSESRQPQDTQEGRSFFPVDLTGYSSPSSQEQDDISDGPAKQARQLKAHVDDIYQHSQELRDAQETMQGEMQQIKDRFRSKQEEIRTNYSKAMQVAREGEHCGDNFSCFWNLNPIKQFQGAAQAARLSRADYEVQNGVIILHDYNEEQDDDEESNDEEPGEFCHSPTPPPRSDPPPSNDPGGYHPGRQAFLDDRSDESPEPALHRRTTEKSIVNIPRYMEEHYDGELDEEEAFGREGRKSGVILSPALQRVMRRQNGENDSCSSASQSLDVGSIEQFSRRRALFWDCGSAF